VPDVPVALVGRPGSANRNEPVPQPSALGVKAVSARRAGNAAPPSRSRGLLLGAMRGTVRGVLFDAGGVLIRPVGGRWNPRYDFESVVLAHHPRVPASLFPAAFAEGQRVLDGGATTPDRTDYHRAMLRVLGVAQPSPALLRELEDPPAGPAIEAYPDARPVLDELSARGVRMSVVSDAWAGLELAFRALDIERYFAGFVISQVLGCRKPDPRMYAAGSALLGLEPVECLFIDDDPELVAAAVGLGYHGVALVRDGGPVESGVDVITSLDELLPVVFGT
jgi:putative hydrolase of the HAD superfamily